jgi:hypothetical protein
MGVEPRAVTLFFNWTLPLYRNRETALAQAVARTVCDNLPPADESADLECRYGSIQPREVDEIVIHRVRPVEGFDWTWTETSRRIEDAVLHISAAIERKSKTIRACLEKCDQCWLLIVAGAPLLRASGNIRSDEHSLNFTYTSPFARTYFLDFGRGSAAQLKTIPAQG